MSKHSHAYKRLFSLFGLIPLGIYVIVHLYKNMASLGGPESFNQQVEQTRSLPLIVPIMILVIWIPILFHGIYGLFIMKQARPNLTKFPYFENFKFILQRLSGIGLLLFIPAHIYKAKIAPSLEGHSADFTHMMEGLSDPLTLVVYILGVLGVAYHLANGLWQFSIGWGLTVTQQSMQRMQWLSYALFIGVAAMGYLAIWGFLR